MQTALRLSTYVRPGGKIEVSDSQLPLGRPVDLIVLFSPEDSAERRSVIDVLADAPGHLAFQNAEDVDTYLREERDAWER